MIVGKGERDSLIIVFLLKLCGVKEVTLCILQNCLDVCLKHANTSVVLGAIQVFLHYTSGLTELRDDVFNRIKGVSLKMAFRAHQNENSIEQILNIQCCQQYCSTLLNLTGGQFRLNNAEQYC